MNRVRPIENRWTTRKEREEAGGGLRINHNRLQASASFFFFFFLLLLSSTTKQIIYIDTILFFSSSPFVVRRILLSMSVWLEMNDQWISYKQKILINSHWTTSKFPSLHLIVLNWRQIFNIYNFLWVYREKKTNDKEHRFSSDITLRSKRNTKREKEKKN